jgi:hypothetical protein
MVQIAALSKRAPPSSSLALTERSAAFRYQIRSVLRAALKKQRRNSGVTGRRQKRNRCKATGKTRPAWSRRVRDPANPTSSSATLPALMCSIATAVVPNSTCTLPPSKSFIHCKLFASIRHMNHVDVSHHLEQLTGYVGSRAHAARRRPRSLCARSVRRQRVVVGIWARKLQR